MGNLTMGNGKLIIKKSNKLI